MAGLSKMGIWLVATGVAIGTPANAAQVIWQQTYHDSGHTSDNPHESILTTANVPNLQVAWGQDVTCGVLNFALDESTIYAQGQGSDCNTPDLEAIDAATGAKKWTVTAGGDGLYLQGTIAEGNGLVFAGCGFKDTGSINYGAVCAYRKINGKLAWQFSNPCNCQPESGVVAPLVYSNSVVYFGYGNGGGTCGGDTNYLVAADAKTGAVLWTYVTGGCGSLDGAAPAVADGHVYFEANDNLVALSQTDGSFLWSVPFGGGSIEMGLTARNGAVYDNVDNNGAEQIAAFDGATGTPRWTFNIGNFNPGSGTAPGALANGLLYVTGIDHQIYALHASSGKLKWSGAAASSSAAVANGVLYVDGGPGGGGSGTGATAYAASNGANLWESGSDRTTIFPPPIVANGVLYVANGGSSCSNMCAYALPAGVVQR